MGLDDAEKVSITTEAGTTKTGNSYSRMLPANGSLMLQPSASGPYHYF